MPLSLGGEKGWGTYILATVLTVFLIGFTGFAVYTLVAYEKTLNEASPSPRTLFTSAPSHHSVSAFLP